MTYAEAVAVPIGAPTALRLLRKGKIQRGQKVLIYGASGSVGTYAVQIARSFGAEVTGVCSTAHLELVRSWGRSRSSIIQKRIFQRAERSITPSLIRKAVIYRCYPLDQMVEAHRYVETGRKAGNVVIQVA